MRDLNRGELMVLAWLGRGDGSPLGECQGFALAELAARGLVEIGPIPRGRSDPKYRPVTLTDAGWAVLRARPE